MVPSWLAMGAPLVVLLGLGVQLSRRARRPSPHTVAKRWDQTVGTIVSTSIQVRRVGSTRTETPVVTYAYHVNGTAYQGGTVRVIDDRQRARLAGDASRTIARYPVGSTVTVFYDPADPSRAALER